MTAARRPQRDKISAQFAARLQQTPADRPCKSIVLLETVAQPGGSELPARARRKAAVETVKASSQAALKVVDEVLELKRRPPPDRTARCTGLDSRRGHARRFIQARALKEVKAVLEDQNVFPLPTAKT